MEVLIATKVSLKIVLLEQSILRYLKPASHALLLQIFKEELDRQSEKS